jgi:hypothetical protein
MLFTDLPEDYLDIFEETTLQERLRVLLEYEPCEPNIKRRRMEDDLLNVGPNDRVFALLIVEARCRLAFKKLLNIWLKRRADKIPLNTDDPITLCPYDQPLIVYDMTHRSRHCFEAKTLITNIYHQLRYSFGGFPKPLSPMNPITNLAFGRGQLTHIFDSALRLGYYSAPLVAFRDASFDINIYNYLQERPLRFAAISEFIYGSNHKHIMIEELMNFIVSTSNKRNKYMTNAEIRRLSFGLKNGEHPYVEQWMRLFEEFLKYDLKGTPSVRFCPEQIKRSRSISAELNILVPALSDFLEQLKAPYNAYIAQQQVQINTELANDDDELDYDDDVEDDTGATVIFTANGNIETTFTNLLARIISYNNNNQFR